MIGLILLLTATLTSATLAPPPYEPGGEGWDGFAVDVADAPLRPLAAADTPLPAPAAPATYAVTFKGEVAGIKIGRVMLSARIGGDAYDLRYAMEQNGVARWFSDGQARAHAAGLFAGPDAPAPIAASYYHNHDYEAANDQQRVELYRAPGARRLRLWSEPRYTFHAPVDEETALGATDPLGALIALGFPQAAPGRHPCERTARVFDGRRRFDLFLNEAGGAGTERLRAGGKGRFEGDAYRCELTMRKVGGYRPKDRAEVVGRVWVHLAEVPSAFRTRTFAYVPVRVTGKLGILTAVLEGKDPTITGPDGESVNLGRR